MAPGRRGCARLVASRSATSSGASPVRAPLARRGWPLPISGRSLPSGDTRGGHSMDPKDLRGLPLFESLSKRELERVSRWMDEVDVTEGRHIVDQGALAWEFFVIIDGEAEVLRDGQHQADLGPGDYFGEIALHEGDRRTASVVAKSPMRIAVMLGRDFHEMEEEMP